MSVAGLRRLARRSEVDDEALGDLLTSELDQLKGLAMKVGQMVSYLEVGLPPRTQEALEQLHRGVRPLDTATVLAVLERSLGQRVGRCFDRFDPVPVAAASIGQVHRARVHGREVAVKIRYPGIEATIAADLQQLRTLARVASLATAVDGAALVEELRERILEECDYALEATHQRRTRSLLAGDPTYVVPAVVDDRSTADVLTTTWSDGAPLLTRLVAGALPLARLPWTTIFRHLVLHADPHPGNFLVEDGGALVVLDHGNTKRLEADRVEMLRAMFGAALAGDRPGVMEHATAFGLVPPGSRVAESEFAALLEFLLAPYRTSTYRFERGWWEQSLRSLKRPGSSLRHVAIPRDWLWIQRALVGLHAVLLRTDRSWPLGDLAREALSTRPAPE